MDQSSRTGSETDFGHAFDCLAQSSEPSSDLTGFGT